MSMAQGKADFLALWADQENRVLALTGPWGTGKSALWKAAQATDPVLGDALCVSLFGVSTLRDLQLKLAQNALPPGGAKGAGTNAALAALKHARQLAKSLFSTPPALEELALLAGPALARGRVIVLDDVERKHAGLAIDEVLGFIDDLAQNHGCRALLILNPAQLADRAAWDRLKDKVIDQELRLQTTAAEAFEVAARLAPTAYAPHIRRAVEACGITNIRIVRKVIRLVNGLLPGTMALAPEALDRLVPSAVLLAAIHYQGLDDGPTTEFVLNFDPSAAARTAAPEREIPKSADGGQDPRQARWTQLIRQLGILATDEYEQLVAKHLATGLLDRAELDRLIARHLEDLRLAATQERAHAFFQNSFWHPDLTEQQVVAAARQLLPDIPSFDPYFVTSLHDYVSRLEPGQALAREMIEAWISGLRRKSMQPGADPQEFSLKPFLNQRVHPDIVQAVKQIQAGMAQPRSLLDVCLHLAQGQGWSYAEEAVMRAASVDDFVQTILGISGDTLKTFMLKNMELYARQDLYDQHFGSASLNFLRACKRITTQRRNTRWASLIETLFEEANLGLHLEEVAGAGA